MLKVTAVYKHGASGFAHSVEVNESGYVLLPEDPEAIAYHLYAPWIDEKETGPWYFLRTISRREAKQARRTVVGEYKERDLIPHLLPQQSMEITFPAMRDDQTHWALFGNGRPIGLFWRMGNHHEVSEGV